METVLKTTMLTKTVKKSVIADKINISIEKGDVYGFLGPNGAGKSTTIKMILGLVRPSSGSFVIRGSVGAMVEYPSFYQNLSGRRNLEIFASYMSLSKDRIDEVLSLVGLINEAGKNVGKYSLGMKQRLGIARAFLGNPDIVILDEPTNGLDPEGVIEIRELIEKLSRERNTTFMISSHILSEIRNMCNKIAIIKSGKILVEGEINTLLKTAETDSLEEFYIKTLKEG
jgi:ABC-2 type transport system ATP-binding protein